MKRVFMILGTCLLAAMTIVSCGKTDPNKPEDKPDDKPTDKPEDKPEDKPQAFSMEVAIDGDFSEWDTLTADTADGETYVYEENTSSEFNGMLRLKLTSDADYIYVYTELLYDNIFVTEGKKGIPLTCGSSGYGFGPDLDGSNHPGTPGGLIIYVGGDGDDSKLYGARADNSGQSMWDYMGFDAWPQYYFAWDTKQDKMQLGWPQNNWPEMDDAEIGQPLSGHDRGWVADTPDHDYDVTTENDIKFSKVVSLVDPVSKKNVSAIQIEFAMARDAILGTGVKVNGQAIIGAFYEQVGSEEAHQTNLDGSGRIPSKGKPLTLKLK